MITEADKEKLRAPHIARAWFLDLQLPSGRRRLHTGDSQVTIGGYTWEGVVDPLGGTLVTLSEIQEARFGTAPIVRAVLSGAPVAFLKEVWDNDAEGARADLYWAAVDGETGAVLIDLTLLFEGRLTAPRFVWAGPGKSRVHIGIGIESINAALNFPSPNMDWTPAAQRARWPGDRGLDWVGSDIIEEYKA
ncbi:transcriptional regulator [Acuticoccus sediminis]|uniref:transcriptional regulator n=1 Tax=Acuticoccus sediminis TaxID=2184697 RepID=UPI001CFCD624|nr:transcriptional regulator [Acuticoccus sediminis]